MSMNTNQINYVTGDATRPNTTPAIIAHICNNKGGWGKGFTGALSKRYLQPEELYRFYWRNQYNYTLGCIQTALCGDKMIVTNMIAQNGYSEPGKPAIDYDALGQCLAQLADTAKDFLEYSVHMPRIGTGLAGGKWEIIEPLIQKCLCARGVRVTVYDL